MDTSKERVTASGDLENIPEELRHLHQWVVWKYEKRDGKPTKVPYNARTGSKANVSTTKGRGTWSTFEGAVQAFLRRWSPYDGLGFVFTDEDPYAGVDADAKKDKQGNIIKSLIDPETGELEGWVREIIEGLGGYAEVSPSGAGVHAIVRGKAPNKRRGQVEAYSSGRFFAFTGRAIRGSFAGEEIPHRQEELDALTRKYLEKPPVETERPPDLRLAPVVLSDEEIIKLCRSAGNASKFSALYDAGDTDAHSGGDKSHSGADLALLDILAFYTQDEAQLERLFSDSALGQREKWRTRAKYRRDTIKKAISDLRNRYTGRRSRAPSSVGPAKPAIERNDSGADLSERKRRFEQVDLGDAVEHGVEPAQMLVPDILYASGVHSVYSAGGTGKTFFALWLIKQVLDQDLRVMLLDQENGKRIISERLRALGVGAEQVRRNLYYYPFPSATLDAVEEFEELLDEVQPALVVFDSWINFLSGAGFDENSSGDIEQWGDAFTSKVRKREMAALLLDHVPKEGRGSRGSGRKRDYIDLSWELRKAREFSRETVGRITLHLDKDREGWVPKIVAFTVGGKDGSLVFGRAALDESDAEPEGLMVSDQTTLDALKSFGPSVGARYTDWRKEAENRGIPKTTFDRSKKSLEDLGLVEKVMGKYFVVKLKPSVEGPQGGSSPTGLGAHGTSAEPTDGTSTQVEGSHKTPAKVEAHLVPRESHGTNGTRANGGKSHGPTTLWGGTMGLTKLGPRQSSTRNPGARTQKQQPPPLLWLKAKAAPAKRSLPARWRLCSRRSLAGWCLRSTGTSRTVPNKTSARCVWVWPSSFTTVTRAAGRRSATK